MKYAASLLPLLELDDETDDEALERGALDVGTEVP